MTALATDADTGATISSYALTAGGDTFAIDSSTGVVTVKDVGSGATGLNYESAQSHTITVEATASDGQTSTKDYVINVTNVADVAVGTISDSDSDTSNNTVAENASLGDATNLGFVASDGDTGATIRAYELTDDAGGLFTINPTTGAVTVAGSLDYETATSHTITVKATSTDGDTNTQNFTISVTNVADNTPY